MRWETYGWQMGKITGMVTSGTPRLIKKFNYRIVWADGSKGPAKLQVDNYAACSLFIPPPTDNCLGYEYSARCKVTKARWQP